MRILIISPEFEGYGGGIATFYRVLVEALRQEDLKIRIIEGSAFHAADDRATRTYNGIQIETLEKQRLASWSQQFSAFAATPRLRAHLSAAWAMWEQADYGADVDLVEATDWGLLFVPPAVEASRPLIVQCHGSIGQIADHDPIASEETDSLAVRLIERSVLGVAGAVQTHSRANAAFWHAETGRAVATIYPAWISPSEPESLSVNGRGLVVGRLQRWKGSVTLCEALRRLGRGAPSVDWFGRDTVWGARDHYTSGHLARTFPDVWGKRLFHHPQISPAEVTRRQSSTLFNIVPSTWDTFNFTVVEAMASGRPTIVSTGAGASELINDGVNGFLFANEDSAALAETIERVLSESPARLAEIGREGSNTVRAALDPKTIALQRLAAYHAAIDAFQVRPRDPVNGWLGTICRPSEAVGNDIAFLENLPLRALAKHVAGRISRKVRPR
jgi:glycosyltransferase involved in cell wall biosynthesis